MDSVSLFEIEQKVNLLSLSEQRLLAERLSSRLLRVKTTTKEERFKQLQAMASDPEIQRELSSIESEFRNTESDGLTTQ